MKVRGFKDTIRWYDANAEQYHASANRISFESSIVRFLALLPQNPKVLEAGCSTGRDAQVFHDKGAVVTGIDISKGLLAVARREHPDVTFIKADFTRLPFEDNSYDGIWAHASLVHFETLDEVRMALAEFFRVLKTGGHLYVFVKRQHGEEETAIVSDALSNHDRFFRYYTPEKLKELLTEAGFEVGEYRPEKDLYGRKEVAWIEFIVHKPNAPENATVFR